MPHVNDLEKIPNLSFKNKDVPAVTVPVAETRPLKITLDIKNGAY